MAITSILQRIAKRLNGFRGIVLIGKDALIVEKYGVEDPSFDALAVEFLSLLNKFDVLLDERDNGPVAEATIQGTAVNYFMTGIDENYILFLGAVKDENIGRCRFELQKAAMDLRRELAE
mgnify:CR=1 FL=1